MFTSDDNEEYRKNARNMAFILAAITIAIFASILIPPLVNPVHEQFSSGASVNSPYGFSLDLSLNATRLESGVRIIFIVWINSTSRQISNVTA